MRSLIIVLVFVFGLPSAFASQSLPTSAVGRIYVEDTGESALATLVGPDLVLVPADLILPIRKNPEHEVLFTPGQRYVRKTLIGAIPGQVEEIDFLNGVALIRLDTPVGEDFAIAKVEKWTPESNVSVMIAENQTPVWISRAGLRKRFWGVDIETSKTPFKTTSTGAPVFVIEGGEYILAGVMTAPCNSGSETCGVSSSLFLPKLKALRPAYVRK